MIFVSDASISIRGLKLLGFLGAKKHQFLRPILVKYFDRIQEVLLLGCLRFAHFHIAEKMFLSTC